MCPRLFVEIPLNESGQAGRPVVNEQARCTVVKSLLQETAVATNSCRPTSRGIPTQRCETSIQVTIALILERGPQKCSRYVHGQGSRRPAYYVLMREYLNATAVWRVRPTCAVLWARFER